MGAAINRRRQMGQKNEKVLFELYNTYFNGTVKSVIDTGIKLWDGNHNRFKLEVEYQREVTTSNIPVYVCKPDVEPYSGIRLRRINNKQESFIISESVTDISTDGFTIVDNQYGHQVDLNVAYNNRNVHTLIRDGDYLKMEFNGHVYECRMNNPQTNNLNLLLGCDYKGESGTQRYFNGTIYKFKLTEL